MVTELCLTFVYRCLLPSTRKAKQRTLPTHYQSVVLVWLKLVFLSDFYFKKLKKQDKSVYLNYLEKLIHLFIVEYLKLDLDKLDIELIDYAFDK